MHQADIVIKHFWTGSLRATIKAPFALNSQQGGTKYSTSILNLLRRRDTWKSSNTSTDDRVRELLALLSPDYVNTAKNSNTITSKGNNGADFY